MFKGKNITIKILVAAAVVLDMGIIAVGYTRSTGEGSGALKISEVIEASVSSAFMEVLSSADHNSPMNDLNGSRSITHSSDDGASHGLNPPLRITFPFSFLEDKDSNISTDNGLSWVIAPLGVGIWPASSQISSLASIQAI